MRGYVLSPKAQQSLIDISEYTEKNFGSLQRKKYLGLLRDRMRMAAKEPGSGRARHDIKPGYYSIVAGKHMIYYRTSGELIEIIDVLHQSMDSAQQL